MTERMVQKVASARAHRYIRPPSREAFVEQVRVVFSSASDPGTRGISAEDLALCTPRMT